MPKVQKTPVAAAADVVATNVATLAAAHGLRTDREIAKRISMCHTTYCNRRHDPSSWRLDELVMVATAFKVSLAWLTSPHKIGEE